jgi:Spy/CpxP family protein refolding chaperone
MRIHLNCLARTTAAFLATGLLGTLIATAADPQPDPAQRERAVAAERARAARPQAQAPADRGLRRDLFTDAQRDLLRESSQSHAEALRKLSEQLRAAEKELTAAILAEKQDEKAVREKADALAKLEADLTVLRARIVAPVVPTLTPEQREQIENSPMVLRMIGAGLGGGPGAGGRGAGNRGGDGGQRGNRPPRQP